MEYTVIVENQSYDLPPKTLNVMEEIERVSKVDLLKGVSIREKYRIIHDFLKTIIGAENVQQILGSDRLEEIDLSELTLMFKKIVEAYDRPLAEYEAQQLEKRLAVMPLDKVTSITEALDKAAKSNWVQK